MAASDGSIIISVELDTRQVEKGLSNIKGQVNGLSNTFSKLGKAVVAAFSVREILNFGAACIELGSNVAEIQNVVGVAFGDLAYRMEDFADTAIQSFGMSELAAKKTASTYMAMATSMGIQEDAAADMALALTGLSGDVASFYNISQELADTKLKSVFTGETETLKELGVVMTETNLEVYALSRGIGKSLDQMTQAEKVTLRYGYVMDQLALAQGDFVRTQDSWANQTRILAMQWEQFMAVIGEALTTVLLPLVTTLNQIVAAMISVAEAASAVITSLFGGADTQIQETTDNASAVGAAIGGSVDQQDNLTEATEETAKAQKKALAGFDEINKLSTPQAASSQETGLAIATPSFDVSKMEEGTDAITGRLGKILDMLKAMVDEFKPIGDALANAFLVAFDQISLMLLFPPQIPTGVDCSMIKYSLAKAVESILDILPILLCIIHSIHPLSSR